MIGSALRILGFSIRYAAPVALAGVLAIAQPVAAADGEGEGGDPESRISVFKQLTPARARPKQARIVPATALVEDARWHDKTEAQWRAYYHAMRELRIQNAGD